MKSKKVQRLFASLAVLLGLVNGMVAPIALANRKIEEFVSSDYKNFSLTEASPQQLNKNTDNNGLSFKIDAGQNNKESNFLKNEEETSSFFKFSQSPSTASALQNTSPPDNTTIPVGSVPWGVAVNPVTNRIFVTESQEAGISMIDGATNTRISHNRLNPYLHVIGDAAVNPTTNLIYTGSGYGLNIIDGNSNQITTNIALYGVNGVAVNPVTNRIFVSHLSGSLNYPANISVMDGATNQEITPDGGILMNLFNGDIAVNTKTNRIYVTTNDYFNSYLYVLDGANDSFNIIDRIALGDDTNGASGVTVDENTNRIYVANYHTANVSVVDGATNTVLATIPTVGGPNNLALSTATNRLYVAGHGVGPDWVFDTSCNCVPVIDTATNTVINTINIPGRPFDIDTNSELRRVYVSYIGWNDNINNFQDCLAVINEDNPNQPFTGGCGQPATSPTPTPSPAASPTPTPDPTVTPTPTATPVATPTITPTPTVTPTPTDCPATTLLEDNFDSENGGIALLNYYGFANWDVTRGSVDLLGPGNELLPGNGMYLDLDGSAGNGGGSGKLESKTTFALNPGTYQLTFKLAGNQRGYAGFGPDTVNVSLGDVFNESFTLNASDPFTTITRTVNVTSATSGKLIFDHQNYDFVGLLLDSVKLTRSCQTTPTPTITPTVTPTPSVTPSPTVTPVPTPTVTPTPTPANCPPVSVTVPGTSNPWLAGMPNGSPAFMGDKAPDQSPIQVTGLTITQGTRLKFTAGGRVFLSEIAPAPIEAADLPDGSVNYQFHAADETGGVENGIGNINAPLDSLIGVFLDDSRPDSTPPPASVDFSTPASRDYLTYTPQLKKPFFIGDGKTSAGAQQEIIVPAGATRLYLGTMDGMGWNNNIGAFNVTVTSDACGGCGSFTRPAGGVFITGDDPDYHAFAEGAGINLTQKAVAYVTHNKPNPRMLLVMDLRDPGVGYVDSRLGLKAAGFTVFDVADFGSGQQGAKDLHNVNFGDYDVVVVASDLGGWLRQDELDILNARRNDLIGYVNNGGGLVVFAESGEGYIPLTTHDRFGFLPFLAGYQIVNDYNYNNATITPTGTAMGLTTYDVAQGASHNRFPSGTGLDPVYVDSQGRNIALATQKHIGLAGALSCETTPTPPPTVNGLPGNGGIYGPGTQGVPRQVTRHISGTGTPNCNIRLTITDTRRPSSTNNNRTINIPVDSNGNWSIDLTLDDCDPVIEIVQDCPGSGQSEPIRRQVYVDGTPPRFINGSGPSDGIHYTGSGGTSHVGIGGGDSEDMTLVPGGGVTYKWYRIGSGGSRTILGGGGSSGVLTNGGAGLEIDLPLGGYDFELEVCDTAGNCITKRCHHTVLAPLTLISGLPAEGGLMGPVSGYSIARPGVVKTTLTGKGNPNCLVEVKISDAVRPTSALNNRTLSVPVDSSGNWSLALELDDCDPVIEIKQICPESSTDVIRRHIYIDTTAPVIGLGNGAVAVGSVGTGAINLVAGASDPSRVPNNTLSYRWSIIDSSGSRQELPCANNICPSVYTINKPIGEYFFEVEVTDAAGNKSVKRCRWIVYGFASGTGTFVIGNQNAVLGNQVNFWGAQWHKNNTLTGGDGSPSSFKGYFNQSSVFAPSCGATWTTTPGNSPPPPDSIPQYMGIVASSVISKNGSVIFGDVNKIVIVKTDAGYSSNPGHEGTGTIVDFVCQ